LTGIHEVLRVLGNAFGIEPDYSDTWGKIHRTDPETARRILEAKGVKIASDRMHLNPQVVVVCANNLPERCSIYLEKRIDHPNFNSLQGTIRIIDTKKRMLVSQYDLPSAEARLQHDEKSDLMFLSVAFPTDLDTGEHQLTVEATIGDEQHSADCRWIVCPAKAYIPPSLEKGGKIAGVSVALYGVRSRKNWGVGDFSDLKAIVDWAREDLKVDFVGLNPLHALFNRRPYHSSPYLPSSRLYRNFIYLDVPGIPDFGESRKAQSLVNSSSHRRLIQKLRDEAQVNYEEVSAVKLQVLRAVFGTFMKNHGKPGARTQRWDAFQHYMESEGVFLERFATFCALREHFESRAFRNPESWREWPAPFHDPSSLEVERFRTKNKEQVLFWMYLQWQLEEQAKQIQQYAIEKGMIIGLYNDQALAVDRNGADFWAWQQFFADGFTVGAPPDAFAPDGQDWGFPPPDRDMHRFSGYRLFLKMLETNCKHAGALRIDHVMQLYHLFWIPGSAKPKDGVYVKDYEDDLLNILALASQKRNALIIGEDLGTVPMNFRERLMAKGVLSYRLFYFEKDWEGNQCGHEEYPRSALVSITTHDLPTLKGFWAGHDIEVRQKIGQLDDDQARTFRENRRQDKAKMLEKLVQEGFLSQQSAAEAVLANHPTEPLHEAILRFLFRTPSALVIISQEDIFLDPRQQNIPGTTRENPNWVTKMLYTVEELKSDPEAVRLSRKFGRLIEETGRSTAHNS